MPGNVEKRVPAKRERFGQSKGRRVADDNLALDRDELAFRIVAELAAELARRVGNDSRIRLAQQGSNARNVVGVRLPD